MRKYLIVPCLCLVIGLCAIVGHSADNPDEEEKQQIDRDFPPCMVNIQPAFREKDVDFTLREIKVTFDRPMQTEKSWSWIIHTNLGVYPGYRPAPDPRWENDGKTCVLPVRLSPDTVYAVGVNSFQHTGFRDTEGKAAVPYVWVFKTSKPAEGADPQPEPTAEE